MRIYRARPRPPPGCWSTCTAAALHRQHRPDGRQRGPRARPRHQRRGGLGGVPPRPPSTRTRRPPTTAETVTPTLGIGQHRTFGVAPGRWWWAASASNNLTPRRWRCASGAPGRGTLAAQLPSPGHRRPCRRRRPAVTEYFDGIVLSDKAGTCSLGVQRRPRPRRRPRGGAAVGRRPHRPPPAIVVLGGCDVLRDEGRACRRLAEAGMPTHEVCYPGPHGCPDHDFPAAAGRRGPRSAPGSARSSPPPPPPDLDTTFQQKRRSHLSAGGTTDQG